MRVGWVSRVALLGPVAWAAATVGAILTDVSVAVRAPIVLGFVLVCPGFVCVRLIRIDDVAARIALATAISLTLAAGLSMMVVHGPLRSTNAALGVLVTITVVGTTVRALRAPNDGDAA